MLSNPPPTLTAGSRTKMFAGNQNEALKAPCFSLSVVNRGMHGFGVTPDFF